MNTNRQRRLLEEEELVLDVQRQLIWLIQQSIGCHLFNSLCCLTKDKNPIDPLFGGKLACVNHVSQILILVGADLWQGPAGTWVKFTPRDLGASGWYQIKIEEAVPGDIIIWDSFDENQHVGFYWSTTKAVSMCRVDPTDKTSSRAPGIHPLYFEGEGRVDGPRTIQSVWTHDYLRRDRK
jgi:hypothetical protein